ncbi:hypothetical protein SLUN_01185 [Streptomyces lunaelactis]|uniref:Uncharacterized protein n=1 Tax=Streptomyces lunaelactis TaxID=1535768 RepID=A0A2R4SW17_9ACTN|nr:hypothetical protein [Streptomyces lunaelactis]AVZ71070.1 hypothetical protein SLUN_01185 [Streptomyces lunaelactis]NUK22653.1 hypothetical protein [Streptomyces lunaelactis]NUK87034.1 hypothetical protein [Streptomyces lunaelactis]
MTRNRARKNDVRAVAPPGEYARTERIMKAEQQRPVLTADVHQRMLAAFRAAGWPATGETRPWDGVWHSKVGPASGTILRPGYQPGRTGSRDPDDPDEADLQDVPEVSFCTGSQTRPVSVTVPGTEEPAAMVQRLGAALADGRAREIALLVNDSACAICGDPYPARHLLRTPVAEQMRVCPACVFDGELLTTGSPVGLALEFDLLAYKDLAVPAGWAAVMALLAIAGGPRFGDVLDEAFQRAVWVPAAHWSDPGKLWIWLPPHSRPLALAGLGPGASLAAVVEAVDRAHPGLQDLYRTVVREELLEEGEKAEDYLVPQLWPAVIAYAVAFGTQALERPADRAPWHVLESFEQGALGGHFAAMRSALDPDAGPGVIYTLGLGALVVAKVLGLFRDGDSSTK